MGRCGMPGSLGAQPFQVAVVKPGPGDSCGGGLAGCDQRVSPGAAEPGSPSSPGTSASTGMVTGMGNWPCSGSTEDPGEPGQGEGHGGGARCHFTSWSGDSSFRDADGEYPCKQTGTPEADLGSWLPGPQWQGHI